MTDLNKDTGQQPGLFDPKTSINAEDVLMYALGDFQERGFELAGREIALDRLLGALKRAFLAFDILPLSDQAIADTLRTMGADVIELPQFVAKHPFRVKVPEELGKQCREYFISFKEN